MIILPVLLTGFKINDGGSRSIPVTSSLVLLLYQSSGKKTNGHEQTYRKSNSQSSAFNSLTRNNKTLALLKAK